MGGTVRAINVAPGDNVTAGQVLIVVEAMKMENEIVAPRGGRIAEVRAAPGESVQASDIVVVFAAE
jgi:acetyl-CoA/propionyl-CoA carboxylase biotin carboxyl carrier protein